MSKLLDKLERISEGSIQPMGFGAAVSRPRIPQMLIIASIPIGNARLAAVAEKEGADALLLALEHLDKKSKNLTKTTQTKSEIPWGGSLETITREEMEHLIEMGCDFIIFAPAKTPAAILNEERICKVLKLDPSLPENLAKAVNRLQVDAVLVSPFSEGEPCFTIQQLMMLERLAGGTGKHILATFPQNQSTLDIETLWGIGVRGVVVDMNIEQPERRLSEIREAIQKLPTTRKKPRERIRATLPLAMPPLERAETEEEEP